MSVRKRLKGTAEKIQNIDAENVKREASEWVARLDGRDLSEKDKKEFRDWHARSPKHRQEFKVCAEIWDQFDTLWQEELLADNDNRHKGIVPKKFKYGALVAASLAFFVMSMVGADVFNDKINHPLLYATQVGEYKKVTLADKSVMTLNTNSQIEILYSDKTRKIRLIRGEASFDVTKDKDRPFLVYAGYGLVRAVGTAFVVQLNRDKVEVTVTEGQVELAAYSPETKNLSLDAQPDNVPKILASLNAGQRAKFDTTIEKLETVPLNEIKKAVSWQTGTLFFDGETLEEVIAEFGRYTTLQIIISDPEIRGIKVSGMFVSNDASAFLNALDEYFDISVQRIDQVIYLSSNVVSS
ncbi:MAG: FecR domain-containing protein [Kordiimonadaceae bacterium]|nr:FecR domain-containing protein [Kordiimonadaceae bacterium]